MKKPKRILKSFIQSNRKKIDISEVATGEHWLAKDALALNLVDNLLTSDDYLSLLAEEDDVEIYECHYLTKKSVSEKLRCHLQSVLSKISVV